MIIFVADISLKTSEMGTHKKLGINIEQRNIAKRYASRFRLHDHKLVIGRGTGCRVLYLEATDDDELEYRIRYDKVKKMSRPKGIQVTNKLFYLKFLSDKIHGKDRYSFPDVKEEMITFKDKIPIECKIHGTFYKRKSAHITDREGCPKCSRNRYNNNRKYYKKDEYEDKTNCR